MNTRGIVYNLLASSGVIVIGALITLYWSRFWNKTKRKKGYFIFGIIMCLIALWDVPQVIHATYDPTVLCHEGYLLEEYSTSHGPPFNNRYVFSNDSGKKPSFYLDTFSRKEIFPDGFQQGARYRIYYDEHTDIILKVEKLEE